MISKGLVGQILVKRGWAEAANGDFVGVHPLACVPCSLCRMYILLDRTI